MRIYLNEDSVAVRTADTFSIRSMSVYDHEVSAWLVSDFEIEGEFYDGEYTIVIDRANLHENYIYTTKVRQIVEGWHLKRGYEESTPKQRRELKEAGTELIYAPGGFTPFIPEGKRLIANFGMSGTSFFVVPENTEEA